MRPQSILMFERLFLASLVASAISFFLGYDAMVEMMAINPGTAQLSAGPALVIGVVALGMAIYLLLWFLIAHRAANAAKWVLVALVGLSMFSLLSSLAAFSFDAQRVLGLASYVLEFAAIFYLFRADAVAWLKGERPADVSTFE